MSKHLYILDPGHGGIDPSTGEYVTPGKRSPKWKDGSILYEGVSNRTIAKLVGAKLKALNIDYVYTVVPSDWRDVGLTHRASIANMAHKSKSAVLISIHSNAAADMSAHGFEVWTSPGQNTSDKYASIWFDEMKSMFPELVGRKETAPDGDVDKESKFTVLTATKCPSFLVETMFHTNEKECKMLQNPKDQDRIAQAIVNTILKIEKQ